jgi:hypothetical protein
MGAVVEEGATEGATDHEARSGNPGEMLKQAEADADARRKAA